MDSVLTQQTPAVYTDFSGLAALRQQAKANPDQAIEKVAGQFESIFLQMMMKSMRDASIDGGLFDSNQLDLYQSMFDQQVALDLSHQGSLGLADIIVSQLSPQSSAERPSVNPFIRRGAVAAIAEPSQATGERHWQPEHPEAFIRDVWQYAENAAAELGVNPEVLVAQSALETGWGRRMIRHDNGANSFNVFGIKAGADWTGEVARVGTLEYRDGVAQREFAEFRAYSSLEEAFADYVTFLKQNPRYQQALEKAADNEQFLAELQAAGYATDPRYAEKIQTILGRESYSGLFNTLKESTQVPLFNTQYRL